MEFYLYNKDDRKSSTLVNLATTFKLNDINYIVYYNTQVEKSVIDIYIGKISYGDQCLVINKIDSDKQNEFLGIIKRILASDFPETEFGDYDNIIDTATIVLESVQKIQIPTTSLDILKSYHNKESEIDSAQVSMEQTNDSASQNSINIDDNSNNSTPESDNNEQAKVNVNNQELKNNTDITLDKNQTSSNSDNFIHSDDKLSGLDNILDEREKKENTKKQKIISTPIVVLLVLTILVAIVLYFISGTL